MTAFRSAVALLAVWSQALAGCHSVGSPGMMASLFGGEEKPSAAEPSSSYQVIFVPKEGQPEQIQRTLSGQMHIQEALEQVGARMVRQGVPAHPGSLLWIADWAGIPIVGMPTCGLFAQATVFDLVIGRMLAGVRLDHVELARLGHGGFLTRAMALRLPAYRAAAERGAVE